MPIRNDVLALPIALLTLSTPLAIAQAVTPIHLNDTGQAFCDNGANAMVSCTAANAGDTGVRPGQDGRFGRDPAAGTTPPKFTKIGGGRAGFDFTRVCWNGKDEGDSQCAGTLVANMGITPSSTPATDWACTRDNVTGLVWSVHFYDREIDWIDATSEDSGKPREQYNNSERCGFTDGWRLPTLNELLSIMDLGLYNPAIDQDYFPNIKLAFWDGFFFSDAKRLSGITHANSIWGVYAKDGKIYAGSGTTKHYVRFVNSPTY